MTGAPHRFEASFLDDVRRRTPLMPLVAGRVQLKKSGKEWIGLCPFHKEKTPSFTVFDDGSRFKCFGCNASGDVFDYVMKVEGGTFADVVRRLASEAGIPIPGDGRQRNGHVGNGEAMPGEWQPILPVPATEPKPSDAMLRCDMLHEYRDASDRTLCYVRRHEAKGDRRKQFVPLTYGLLNGALGWHPRAPLAPRPLYRLNSLSHAASDAVVLLCEGEKAAEAAQELFPNMVAMAWMGGTGAVEHADWATLADRNVIVWPDADDVGRKAAGQIAERLPRARILETAGLPDGFDAADLVDDDPDAWLAARLREPKQRKDDHELPQVQWADVRLSDWDGRTVPERHWIVPDWIPREQVTGLYGVGGINKTDWLIQMLMSSTAGLAFMGYQLEPVGPVYGLFCEDTEAEIVRRASRIAAHYGRSLADFTNFHFASLVGVEAKEFVTFDGPRMIIGPALLRFDQTIMRLGAKLATIDTAPHFFGGNEVYRRDVTRFLTKLDAISMTRGCGLVFTAHPSVRGKTTGTFESGSTAWEGGVRSRLSLHDPGLDDEEGPGARMMSDRRVLTRQKANYAKQGETIELICRDGVFTTDALDPDRAAKRQRGPVRNAAVDAKFLDLMPKAEKAIAYVHSSISAHGHYAPTVFAARKDNGGFSKPEFTRAMGRLLEAGRIGLVPFGPASRGQFKLAINGGTKAE